MMKTLGKIESKRINLIEMINNSKFLYIYLTKTEINDFIEKLKQSTKEFQSQIYKLLAKEEELIENIIEEKENNLENSKNKMRDVFYNLFQEFKILNEENL